MKGKDKCAMLKQIRKEIAAINGIVYLTSECPYEGDDCGGVCPACEAEERYLDFELNRKMEQGGKVSLAGLTLNGISSSFMIFDTDKYFEDQEAEANARWAEVKARWEEYEEEYQARLPYAWAERPIQDLNLYSGDCQLLNHVGIKDIKTLLSYFRYEYGYLGMSETRLDAIEQHMGEHGLHLQKGYPRPQKTELGKQITLEDLHLFPQTYADLLRIGVTDIQKLRKKSWHELLVAHDFDRRFLKEIQMRLKDWGMELSQEPYVMTYAEEKKWYGEVIIEELGFSVRTFNVLKRANINTLEDLIAHTQSDLIKKVRNLGRRSLEEIEEVLAILGLRLAEEEE